MSVILQDSPFFDVPTTATLMDGVAVRVASRQVIVWVSLSPPGLDRPHQAAQAFPGVLDTGFNQGLLLHRNHMDNWTGFRSADDPFVLQGHVPMYGLLAELREADVWLHPNVPGKRDGFSGESPVRLHLELGIAVVAAGNRPRLPLLGMLAIQRNGLKLSIDGTRRRLTIRT